MEDSSLGVMDKTAFAAYRSLRQIADEYKLDVDPPRIVFVGETSTGKSMLVQNFLGFPCTFTNDGIATRCPVAYQLRYNPDALTRRVVKPEGVTTKELAKHIGLHMKKVEVESQFSTVPYEVEIESNTYPDMEILDVPGLVAGQGDPNVRDAVEKITEFYVRNPKFVIVLLVDANQELANYYGGRTVADLCTGALNKGSKLPPRLDYKDHMCTIQTKFDMFTRNNLNGSRANRGISERLASQSDTYFVSMIPDARVMGDESFKSNEQYMSDLPRLEEEYVNQWIREINLKANKAPSFYEEFNRRYRSLIGINVVRQHIQKRWLKAFYQAAPVLNATLGQQLIHANQKYEAALNEYKLADPALIRKSYLVYLADFQKTLGQYAAYKAEIDYFFPTQKYGSTYAEIENGYRNWPRCQQLVWRAHLTDTQLKVNANIDDVDGQNLIDTLDSKCVGASQFSRLHKLFAYMVLSHKPEELTRDEIVSYETHLYGGSSTCPNTEKLIRDVLFRRMRHTFAIGIPWFTQMHTYLLDKFREDVTRHLLSQTQHAHLAKHTAFLSLVELDYHREVRTMLSKAVEAVRHARLSCSSYIQYDITAWIKRLTFRIPSEIQHGFYAQVLPNVFVKNITSTTNRSSGQTDLYREATIGEIFASIKKPSLLDFISGSDSYLTSKRDSNTGSHHDSARKTAQEIYEVTCGRLVNDIVSHFNSNVAIKVVHFNEAKSFSPRSIANQLSHATDIDIARMANLELEKILTALDYWKQQISDLTETSVLLDGLAQQLVGENTNNDMKPDDLKEYAKKSAQISVDLLDSQRQRIIKSLNRSLLADSESQADSNDPKNMIDDTNEEVNEDRFLLRTADRMTSETFLRNIYQVHDRKDVRACLLEGDDLEQDINEPRFKSSVSSNMNEADGTLQEPEVRSTYRNTDLGKDRNIGNVLESCQTCKN
ncbi:unnamed protein product [Adineta steineri]|uniref:Dynamin GTPase domain-containing protein n=1 Tax=Adineta steineri TaxID=433720 RepID=A0A816CXK7_9BILA|nr:unnamed protein product [Adineta steineri]CAF1629032.1 unnamed protein product [Adineta steineri]